MVAAGFSLRRTRQQTVTTGKSARPPSATAATERAVSRDLFSSLRRLPELRRLPPRGAGGRVPLPSGRLDHPLLADRRDAAGEEPILPPLHLPGERLEVHLRAPGRGEHLVL